MTAAPSPPPRDPTDRGAALVITIGFVVMIGAILAALTAAVTSGLGNRALLEGVRDRQYAADGGVEHVIATTRAEIELGALACGDESATVFRSNDVDIRVERLVSCRAVVGGTGLPVTRQHLAVDACVETGAPCADEDVIVRAVVGFELAGDGTVVRAPVLSWSVDR